MRDKTNGVDFATQIEEKVELLGDVDAEEAFGHLSAVDEKVHVARRFVQVEAQLVGL